MNIFKNKRYKDIFEKYIHRGESTPFTLGTIVVVAFCFLLLIIATFTQFEFHHPWIEYIKGSGFKFVQKNVAYTPLIPAMIFIIYLLRRRYSLFLFVLYTIIGFFVIPIFSFGGGYGNVQNYLFGYFLGFIFAIFIEGFVIKKSQNILYRVLAALAGVFSVHICGFIYCVILAIFRVIDFSFIILVVSVLSGGKIIYDTIFSILVILIAQYIKNIFWICMKPKTIKDSKHSKKHSHRLSNNQ